MREVAERSIHDEWKLHRKIRKRKGLSQEKLASSADISNNTLVKIEMGMAKEPTITTIRNIADALDVSIDELAGRERGKIKTSYM